MKYSESLDKLSKWIKVVKNSILVLSGIEAILVLVIGIVSNKLSDTSYGNLWITILLILGLLYLIITIVKIAYNSTFPSSIIEELQAKKELKTLNAEINRKDAINKYVSRTITDLSTCKCEIPNLDSAEDWQKASDEDFIKGIKLVSQTFNNVLNILLNSTNGQFTTGIYVEYFRGFNSETEPQDNGGVYIMRDDFGVSEYENMKQLLNNDNARGLELEIQSLIKYSSNNGKFISKDLKTLKDKNITVLCTNIRDLQERDSQQGVLFIITEQIKDLPEDIEYVFNVFTDLFSHWLDLYEHEVIRRQIQIMKEEVEEGEDKEEVEGEENK